MAKAISKATTNTKQTAQAQAAGAKKAPEKNAKTSGEGGKWVFVGGDSSENTRTYISHEKVGGTVLEIQYNKFAWIVPEKLVQHADAQKHKGRIYLAWDDLAEGAKIIKGGKVKFWLYTDKDGLGAEECEVVPGGGMPSGKGAPQKQQQQAAIPANSKAAGKGAAATTGKGGTTATGKGATSAAGKSATVAQAVKVAAPAATAGKNISAVTGKWVNTAAAATASAAKPHAQQAGKAAGKNGSAGAKGGWAKVEAAATGPIKAGVQKTIAKPSGQAASVKPAGKAAGKDASQGGKANTGKGATSGVIKPVSNNKVTGPAAPASAPPLRVKTEAMPPDWEEHWSDEHEVPYYWNRKTKESLWIRPSA